MPDSHSKHQHVRPLTMSHSDLRADLVDRLRMARRDLEAADGPLEEYRITGFIDAMTPAIVGADLVVRCYETLGPVPMREVDEIVAEVVR